MWLTRLLAQAIGCPVHTWLPQDVGKDVAMEGADRESEHRVTRSHGISDEYKPDPDFRIHLMRDPREVAVSNAFYWDPTPGLPNNLQAAVDQVAEGWPKFTADLHEIADTAIRYEDLLDDPVTWVKFITNTIGIPVALDDVQRAVDEQDWQRKRDGIEAGTVAHGWDKGAAIRHIGQKPEVGRWRKHLSPPQVRTLEDACGHQMRLHGYELSL